MDDLMPENICAPLPVTPAGKQMPVTPRAPAASATPISGYVPGMQVTEPVFMLTQLQRKGSEAARVELVKYCLSAGTELLFSSQVSRCSVCTSSCKHHLARI